MNPHDGFRELDRQWCLCLLARASVGRVVHTRHALPAVLPVHFSLDANSAVVLRTAADSSSAARSTARWLRSKRTRSSRPRRPAGVSS